MIWAIIKAFLGIVGVIALLSGAYLVLVAEPRIYDVGLYSIAAGVVCLAGALTKERRRNR